MIIGLSEKLKIHTETRHAVVFQRWFRSGALEHGMLKTIMLAAALLAAPVVAARRETPDVQMAKALAGRVAQKPVNCISLWGSDSTQIIEGRAIIYKVGSKLYVNVPRSGAKSLREDDILVTRTFGSQLCSIDTVRLVDRGARFPRGFVVLDQFIPYARAS